MSTPTLTYTPPRQDERGTFYGVLVRQDDGSQVEIGTVRRETSGRWRPAFPEMDDPWTYSTREEAALHLWCCWEA